MGTSTPVVYWEIRGNDMKALREFYSGVFDWKFAGGEDARYSNIDGQDKDDGFGLNGGIGAGPGGNWVAVYIRVPDLDQTLVEIEQRGGKVVRGRTDRPGAATFALVEDPEGHMLGIVQA